MEFRGNANQSQCVSRCEGYFKQMVPWSSPGGQVLFYKNEMQ